MRYVHKVTADHVHPDYCFNDLPVLVSQDAEGFSATARGLGCGKTAPTAKAAIHSLFSDNACTNVRISEPIATGEYLALRDFE